MGSRPQSDNDTPDKRFKQNKSVDRRPDNLKGPGKRSCDIKGGHLIIKDVDVTTTVMEERRKLVEVQMDLTDVSDLL